MTAPKTLSAETLHELDNGRVGRAIDALIAQALGDCDDKPGTKAARRVSITISLAPVNDEFGMRGVTTSVTTKLALPKAESVSQLLETVIKGDDVIAELPAPQPSMFIDSKVN